MSVGAVFAVVVVGGLYALGIIKKKKDEEDDRLINILKGTVDALETKVNNQKKEHDETVTVLSNKIDHLTKKLTELEKENETLVKVLQGRDAQTQEFYKKAFEAMEISKATHSAVLEMSKNQTELMKMLIEYLKPGNAKPVEVTVKS